MIVDAVERWAAIEEQWLGRPGIGSKKMLRATGLATEAGKVFASLIDGRLVLKLPAARVDELIEEGTGERFSSGSRPMREWVSVGGEHEDSWDGLVAEAHQFVDRGR